MSSKSFSAHLRSQGHRDRSFAPLGPQLQVSASAFGQRVVSYKVGTEAIHVSVNDFMNEVRESVLKVINLEMQKHKLVKVNFELFGLYYLEKQDLHEIKSFLTNNYVISASTNLDYIYNTSMNIIEGKASEFLERESGWSLEGIVSLEINVNKFNPLRAAEYIPLPKSISQRGGILNIHNNDQYCFAYSVCAAVRNPTGRPDRVGSYPDFNTVFDFSTVNFPTSLKSIPSFERQNNLSINVYGLEKVFLNGRQNYEIVGPLHFTQNKRALHINLLLLHDEKGSTHYCLITNLSRLVSRQITRSHHTKYFCDGCLQFFPSEEALSTHSRDDCDHIKLIMPKTDYTLDKIGRSVPQNKLKFCNYQNQLKAPFVVYCDFECLLKKIDGVENPTTESFTLKTYEHIPFSFSYAIICSFNQSLSKFEIYTGLDAPEKFVSKLEQDLTEIYFNYLKPITPMHPLTPQQAEGFRKASNCHICGEIFKPSDVKVKDHDHFTGLFRGAAHSRCNLNFKNLYKLPILFHNLKCYDSHLFIDKLAPNGETIDIIPCNFEKYVSFTKHLLVDTVPTSNGSRQVFLHLRFLDSFQFLSSSLETLAANLEADQCREVRRKFPEDVRFNIMRQKGVMPYSYLDDISKLKERSLPCMDEFYDSLRDEAISLDDYKRALQVWDVFQCKTLEDYCTLYLTADVLLLADIFENYRDLCLKTYSLDPAHYFTAPGLSWDAMLRYTRVHLDLLVDVDMLHFFKKSIRGGCSTCVLREADANNQFCQNYNPEKETSFIVFLDMTSMYGASMEKPLPKGDFAWLTPAEIVEISSQLLALTEDSPTGYIFEVDLEYAEYLHNAHNDFPFCPEVMVPPGGKYPKLIQNLNDKSKYVIHYLNLKQCLQYGLKLKQIHRALKFSQSRWLKPYIELNTQLRNSAKNAFERDLYKLKINSIYGKTMENVENRVDIKLTTHFSTVGKRHGAEYFISKPNFKSRKVFNENLVAIQLGKLSVYYNKPIYIGFSILEISKTLIYDFFYGYLRANYGDRVRLCYTDTDSLCSVIYTQNFYDDMKKKLEYFDTSNFSENNIHEIVPSPSKIGLMKDEYGGRILEKFLGTGSKAYYVKRSDGEVKKAKGVKKGAIKNQLTCADYKSVVEQPNKVYCTMQVFRSDKHKIFTYYMRKVALSHFDDKRFLLPNSKQTLAWGHKDIPKLTEGNQASSQEEDPLEEFISLIHEVIGETPGTSKTSLTLS